MGKKSFALERKGAKRLQISWQVSYEKVQITLDGALLGGFENKQQLNAGNTFTLPDGAKLHVQRNWVWMVPELHVLKDGSPVRGSASHPRQRVVEAGNALYMIAALSAGAGLIASLAQLPTLQRFGLSYDTVIAAAIYAGCGYSVRAHRSRIALGLGISLYVLDAVAVISFIARPGGAPLIGGFVVRAMLMGQLYQGFMAFGELGKKSARARPTVSRTRRFALAVAGVVIALSVAIGLWVLTLAAMVTWCGSQVEDGKHRRCIQDFANQTGYKQLCSAMRSTYDADLCRGELGLNDRQREACERYPAGIQRDDCYVHLVSDGAPRTLCNLVSGAAAVRRCDAAHRSYQRAYRGG